MNASLGLLYAGLIFSMGVAVVAAIRYGNHNDQ